MFLLPQLTQAFHAGDHRWVVICDEFVVHDTIMKEVSRYSPNLSTCSNGTSGSPALRATRWRPFRSALDSAHMWKSTWLLNNAEPRWLHSNPVEQFPLLFRELFLGDHAGVPQLPEPFKKLQRGDGFRSHWCGVETQNRDSYLA